MKFSHNWNNKLNCDYFTTIRKYTREKYDYYLLLLDKTRKVLLNGEHYCDAKLIGVKIALLKRIDPFLLILDTGSNTYAEIFKKFGIGYEDKVLILMYEKVS